MMNMKTIGLFAGPLICGLACLELSPLISTDAWKVIGLAAWMVIWWVTEAIPIGVTSLLPIVYLSLTGVSKISEASAPYGDKIVFLFLGGFILALSLEKWRIHERVALRILRLTGTSANGVVVGFMIATAVLSMWMSNTATTLMMLPIALSVLELLQRGREAQGASESSERHQRGMNNFGISMMLAVAYGANIGGTMTLIGTPPNIVLASFINDNIKETGGEPLTFLDWMFIGVPFGLVALTLTALLLIFVLYPNRLKEISGADQMIKSAHEALGAWSSGQVRVSLVFVATALCWVFSSPLEHLLGLQGRISDTAIGLTGAAALFMIPSGEVDEQEQSKPLLVWDDMRRLPWDIVLLFGGGLSLAQALKGVGLIHAIGDQFSNLGSVSVMTLGLLTLIALLLTEVMSNVALVNVFIPVVSGVAIGLGVAPLALCAPVTLAASCAFMLPMSTPPNAIVFASGHVQIKHMVRAGLLLNIVAVMWITTLAHLIYF